MRNQGIVGSMLPDLSEAAEQEKGESFFFFLWSTQDGDSHQHFVKGGHFLDLWEKNFSIHKTMICSCVFVPPCHPFPGHILIEN